MKIVSKSQNSFVLVFEIGERYPDALVIFLKSRKIKNGFFFGLGAMVNPEIAFYDIKKKKYLNRRFRGFFEVLGLVGNVAIFGKGIVIHNHVVLGDKNYKTAGGHLNSAKIGATLEICFVKTGPLKRRFDKDIGLNPFS